MLSKLREVMKPLRFIGAVIKHFYYSVGYLVHSAHQWLSELLMLAVGKLLDLGKRRKK